MSARRTLWPCTMAAVPSKTSKPSSAAPWPMMWCSITAWVSCGCGLMRRAVSAASACCSPHLLTVSAVSSCLTLPGSCFFNPVPSFYVISFLSASLVLTIFFCLTCTTFKIAHYKECGLGWKFHSDALLFIQTHPQTELDQITHPWMCKEEGRSQTDRLRLPLHFTGHFVLATRTMCRYWWFTSNLVKINYSVTCLEYRHEETNYYIYT